MTEEFVPDFTKCAYCQEEEPKLKADKFCSSRCKIFFDEMPWFWRNYIIQLFSDNGGWKPE